MLFSPLLTSCFLVLLPVSWIPPPSALLDWHFYHPVIILSMAENTARNHYSANNFTYTRCFIQKHLFLIFWLFWKHLIPDVWSNRSWRWCIWKIWCIKKVKLDARDVFSEMIWNDYVLLLKRASHFFPFTSTVMGNEWKLKGRCLQEFFMHLEMLPWLPALFAAIV